MTEKKAFVRGLAIGMMLKEHTKSEVAKVLGVSRQTTYRWLREYEKGKFLPQKSSGRRSKTSARSDRLLVRLAKKNNFSSVSQLLRMWQCKVSIASTYRRLRAAGLHKRRPLVCPLLTSTHKKMRESWCMKRCAWRSVWNRVIFSDESRFCRSKNDRRITVWREKGECWNAKNITTAVQGHGGSVHVWGAIWKGGRSRLHSLKANVTGERYVQLLREFFNSEGLPENFIFQDDNAPAHRSSLVRNFHQHRGTKRIEWPSKSPDLNPIEHVWDFISKKISDGPSIASLSDLERTVERHWNLMPQNFVDKLIDSMNRRVGAVLKARGGWTKY